jgi:hypothetical protein
MPESNPTINCRRCDTAMEQGYMPDTSRKMVYQTQWFRGAPEVRMWRGQEYGIVDKKDGLSIVVYRCPACGATVLKAPDKKAV